MAFHHVATVGSLIEALNFVVTCLTPRSSIPPSDTTNVLLPHHRFGWSGGNGAPECRRIEGTVLLREDRLPPLCRQLQSAGALQLETRTGVSVPGFRQGRGNLWAFLHTGGCASHSWLAWLPVQIMLRVARLQRRSPARKRNKNSHRTIEIREEISTQ